MWKGSIKYEVITSLEVIENHVSLISEVLL